MNTRAKSFAISIAIHILVVGFFSFLSLAGTLPARTILLDFTLVEKGGAEGSGGGTGEQDTPRHKQEMKGISQKKVASEGKNLSHRTRRATADRPVISDAGERKERKDISGNAIHRDPAGEVALDGAGAFEPAGEKGENVAGQEISGENDGSGKSSADGGTAFGRGAFGDRTFAYIRQ